MMAGRDLHVDDYTTRIRVGAELEQIRRDAGLRLVDMTALLGMSPRSTFGKFARQTSWKLPRLQGWARVLEHRLQLSIVGIRVPTVIAAGDSYTQMLSMSVAFGAQDEDHLHLMTVCNDLIRARTAAGVTVNHHATTIGLTHRAVSDWENEHHNTSLRVVQRYARGLGSSLSVGIVPVNLAVPA